MTRRRDTTAAPRDAHAHALALLAGRAYGVEELRRRLSRAGHEAREIDDAMARLAASGLVDDHAFARLFARSRLVSGGKAPRRVRQELGLRGVPAAIAGAAIADVSAEEDVDPTARLEQLARRRAAALAAFDPATRRRRLYAYLARRGYDADSIARVMALLPGDDAEDPR